MTRTELTAQAAKAIKIAGFTRVADVIFAVFLAIWIVTRHFMFGLLIVRARTGRRHIDCRWDPTHESYCSSTAWFTLWTLLVVLEVRQAMLIDALIVQGLICFWTYRALRVVYKMFRGHELKDDLSDEEAAS